MSSRTAELLVLAAAFAVAHTQSPLFYSNQNQYLLHGAALAGHGHLANDWLATTRDPTPVFSLFVAACYATAGPWLLQPAFFALMMAYFLAARWLAAAVPGVPDTRAARLTFAALFTAAHAGILRWASVQLLGVDYPWYLQAGVAAQYLLGPGIQPSAFGVLLLAAVACFAHERPFGAAALAALAVVMHATYALPAALLTAGFMLSLALRGEGRRAFLVGLLALAIVAPVAIYDLSEFAEADPDQMTAAQRILAFERIPHHCVPARWFDAIAALQVAWCAVGIALLRRTPLFVPLAVAAAGGLLLTLAQLSTDSPALALLFPWRVSTLLVPLATAVVAARLLAWKSPGERGERAAGAALVALVAGGVCVTAFGLGYRTVDEDAIYAHVRATAKPDSVYLLPVAWPKVSTGRGAVSNTFAPPPRAAAGTNQIPVDLQRFRLATGARVYVDFKSVPYAPAEVLEWQLRMNFAVRFNSSPGRNLTSDEIALRMEGITHVVAPASKPFEAHYLTVEYADAAYIVYRVE
jgi:hypothetical protein